MTDSGETSKLNAKAPTFTMSSNQSLQHAQPNTNSQQNGTTEQNEAKGKKPETKPAGPEKNDSDAGAGSKLTGAQLKKQKQLEKAARRAEKVTERGAAAVQQPGPNNVGQQNSQRRPSTNARDGASQGRDQTANTRSLPLRSGPGAREQVNTMPQEKKLDKRVPMLAHLYPSKSTERTSIASAGREIHPAVLALGLQLRDYVICGATARTVATLLVFKKVIQAYSTPAGVALSRHLTTHLSHQITYLSHARPLSVAQGNSIRWLKKLISALDPDIAEAEAKTFLCKAVDTFIREKVTLAGEVIATQAVERIADEGDVLLTYGKSSVVEKTLLSAWAAGKRFRVVVVDSKPLFEGKNLARSLIRAGLTDVRYCLLNGLADVLNREGITKCFLGANSMLGNGRLSSRAGTAMVAMMAKEGGCNSAHGKGSVPVVVLCESVKFTARVALDSITINEIGDADLLVQSEDSSTLTHEPDVQPQEAIKKGGKPNEKPEVKDQNKGLEGWKDQQNLYLVNLMYDVTPAQYLDVVISELGILPPSAVPVVNGVHGGDE